MSSITVHIDDTLKSQTQQKTKKEGVTLTFVVTQALKAYNEGKLKFGLINQDDEITASFDISTKTGKKQCLDSFKSLCH